MVSWDGKYKGKSCPLGVYGYLLNYKFVGGSNELLKGDLSLINKE